MWPTSWKEMLQKSVGRRPRKTAIHHTLLLSRPLEVTRHPTQGVRQQGSHINSTLAGKVAIFCHALFIAFKRRKFADFCHKHISTSIAVQTLCTKSLMSSDLPAAGRYFATSLHPKANIAHAICLCGIAYLPQTCSGWVFIEFKFQRNKRKKQERIMKYKKVNIGNWYHMPIRE